ncbi:hypothetical protein HZS_7898 [Henneguya salminicola]|nr:hypothetical protein HZS_7898 [Henneguya salminicola]
MYFANCCRSIPINTAKKSIHNLNSKEYLINEIINNCTIRISSSSETSIKICPQNINDIKKFRTFSISVWHRIFYNK